MVLISSYAVITIPDIAQSDPIRRIGNSPYHYAPDHFSQDAVIEL